MKLIKVFKKGNWEILTMIDGHYAHIPRNSVILHSCDAYKTDHFYEEHGGWIILDKEAINSECSSCRERAPDEVQALWLLQNMDLV